MLTKKLVITIGRQYGSGGRTVGKNLAESLGIPFYHEEILRITSEKTAIGEQYFRLADEKAGSNLLYKIVDSLKPRLGKPSLEEDIVSPENLFRFQSQVVVELAEQESCIIAGRCANVILREAKKEHVDFFVYADMEKRIERTMDYCKVDEEEAKKRIKKIDRERREYHKYYTGEDWMKVDNYDLMINASRIDYHEMEVLMRNYLEMKGYLK